MLGPARRRALCQTLELPVTRLQRKVKSMQMFRQPVQAAQQGDRVGVCVTQLEPGEFERGIVGAPGAVPLVHAVIGRVRKVRYFRDVCASRARFHGTSTAARPRPSPR